MPATASEHLPVSAVLPGYEGRYVQWGDLNVAFETIGRSPVDRWAPLFRGLPDDSCICHHWGVLLQGSYGVRYADGREEVFAAGQAYFIEPGHVPFFPEDARTVEFTPKAELDRALAVVARNLQARDAAVAAEAASGAG